MFLPHLKTTIHWKFKKDVLSAVNMAVNATTSMAISMSQYSQYMEIAMLMGILSLFVSGESFGATAKACLEIFCSMYGIVVVALFTLIVGPAHEWFYGILIFAFLFFVDIIDRNPTRSKIAQLTVTILPFCVRRYTLPEDNVSSL
jgi:hypothetical protein